MVDIISDSILRLLYTSTRTSGTREVVVVGDPWAGWKKLEEAYSCLTPTSCVKMATGRDHTMQQWLNMLLGSRSTCAMKMELISVWSKLEGSMLGGSLRRDART